MTARSDLATRARAAAIHLAATGLVAALVAALVFRFWYQHPYRSISGGGDLFLLLVAVDVVIGPLITLVVFDRRKSSNELRRDLLVVVAMQVAALAYGLHSVNLARPAVVALEGDRLRVVRVIDLADADFARAPSELKTLSWLGPRFVATRDPQANERLDSIERGLAGEDIGMRPEFWLPAAATGPAYARAAKPWQELKVSQPSDRLLLDAAAAATGLASSQLGLLPMLARRTDWSALVDKRTGAILGYVPYDGF